MRCSAGVKGLGLGQAKMAKLWRRARPVGWALLLVAALQLVALYSGLYDIVSYSEESAALKRGDADPDAAPPQRQLTPLAGRFVQFSAYRQSPRAFYVIGLYFRNPRVPGNPVDACLWRAGSGNGSDPRLHELNTTAVVHYIKMDEHRVPYAVAVVKCEFEREIRAGHGSGGRLYLNIPTFKRGFSRYGRIEWRFSKMETVLALREERNSFSHFQAVAVRPFPQKYAFCGPPIAGKHVRQYWIMHWLTYHMYIMEGNAHFFFYNVGGLTEEARSLLDPFVEAGFVTITNVLDDDRYPSWYHAQVLFINDCLHRTRFVSEWTFFFDLDELLYFQPPLTLGGLLEANADASFMSLGSWPVATSVCREARFVNEWPLERMLYKKQPGPECRGSHSRLFCPENAGRRKFVLNPRKVFTAGVHSLVEPEKQDITLNATTARIDHYRGILSLKTDECTKTRDDSIQPYQDRSFFRRYLRDDTIPTIVGQARQSVPPMLADAVLG